MFREALKKSTRSVNRVLVIVVCMFSIALVSEGAFAACKASTKVQVNKKKAYVKAKANTNSPSCKNTQTDSKSCPNQTASATATCQSFNCSTTQSARSTGTANCNGSTFYSECARCSDFSVDIDAQGPDPSTLPDNIPAGFDYNVQVDITNLTAGTELQRGARLSLVAFSQVPESNVEHEVSGVELVSVSIDLTVASTGYVLEYPGPSPISADLLFLQLEVDDLTCLNATVDSDQDGNPDVCDDCPNKFNPFEQDGDACPALSPLGIAALCVMVLMVGAIVVSRRQKAMTA